MQQAERVITTSGLEVEPTYRPISEYGVIGDCRTAALVGPDGSIDWCCLPHFDSPAIFCRLLDAERGGFFCVRPVGKAQSSMAYLPETNILETQFMCDSGQLQLVDFMPIRHRWEGNHAIRHLGATLLALVSHQLGARYMRDLGNDVAAAHRLQREVTCLEGNVEVELTLKATFDYARQDVQIEYRPLSGGLVSALLWAGGHYLVLVVRRSSAGSKTETAPLALEEVDNTLYLHAALQEGEQLIAALNYARNRAEALGLLARLARHAPEKDLEETKAYWQHWSARCQYDGPYRQAVLRSALALKLCIFEPTGAIVAAPTTSLPEWIGGSRNWDYRFTWLRDSAFTLAALGNLGYYEEAAHYFHFLHDLHFKHGTDIRIMYGVHGEMGEDLKEYTLDHLSGYRASRPVRVGNGASLQRQLDIYGEVLDAAYSYIRHLGFRRNGQFRGPMRDLWTLTMLIAEYVTEHWQDQDQGIWEMRSPPQAFVYSRVMCWVALDRACRIARHYQRDHRVQHWAACRDSIRQDILQYGYSERLHSFIQAYGHISLDAANLRLLLVKFLPPADFRMKETVEATMRLLSEPRGLLYRYRSVDSEGQAELSDDGLPGKDGAFLACSFWLIDNLCYLDRTEEARERFENLLQLAGPLGLFAEEVDPDSGEQLGNYPQAFTHIGLINSAITLQRAQTGRLLLHSNAATHGR